VRISTSVLPYHLLLTNSSRNFKWGKRCHMDVFETAASDMLHELIFLLSFTYLSLKFLHLFSHAASIPATETLCDNSGCGAGVQAILDGWSRSQKFLDGGVEACNSGSSSSDLCK